MLLSRFNGSTGLTLRVKLRDSSQSDGRGLVNLTPSSSGLRISTIASSEATAVAYTQAGGTIETIATLGVWAAPTAGSCRFREVDATNHPGVYELQFADARFAVSNSKHVLVSISGAANLEQTDFVIDQGASADVRLWNGTLVPTPHAAGYPIVTVKDGTGTGEIDTASGRVLLTNGSITASSFAAGAIDASALAADAGTEIAAAVLAAVVESQGSITLAQAVRLMLGVLAGVTTVSGATFTVKTSDGVATRATFTLNASKERTAVTLNP